jgi:hypothetical protein
MESAVLGVLLISLARSLGWEWVPLSLMHSLRDEEDLTRCLGFFSDYKWMGDVPCHRQATVMGVLMWVASAMKQRRWAKGYTFAAENRWKDNSHLPVKINLIPAHGGSEQGLHVIPTNQRLGAWEHVTSTPCLIYIEEFKPTAHATLPPSCPIKTPDRTIKGPMWAMRMCLDKEIFGPNIRWMVDFASCLKQTVRDLRWDPVAPVHWHDWERWPQRYLHAQGDKRKNK